MFRVILFITSSLTGFFSTQEIPIAILSRVRIFVEMLCYVAVYIKM